MYTNELVKNFNDLSVSVWFHIYFIPTCQGPCKNFCSGKFMRVLAEKNPYYLKYYCFNNMGISSDTVWLLKGVNALYFKMHRRNPKYWKAWRNHSWCYFCIKELWTISSPPTISGLSLLPNKHVFTWTLIFIIHAPPLLPSRRREH